MILKDSIRVLFAYAFWHIDCHVKTSWDMDTLIMWNKWKSGKQLYWKVYRYTFGWQCHGDDFTDELQSEQLYETHASKKNITIWAETNLVRLLVLYMFFHGNGSQCFCDWELWNDAWLLKQREGFGLSLFILPHDIQESVFF